MGDKMDTALFASMLSDKDAYDLKKLGYKYPKAGIADYVALLKKGIYRDIPLHDFDGNGLVYMSTVKPPVTAAVKRLMKNRDAGGTFGINAMEKEIAGTFTIESIDFTRESVRKIMRGYAPADESENRIFGMKKGLEFIADKQTAITEDTIHTLYRTAIGEYLDEDDRLQPGRLYRHGEVFVVGEAVEHSGLPYEKLPAYMAALVDYINTEDDTDELLKGAVIHFYLSYLHPYFDGNGRMARLLQLWYFVRRGFPGSMFVPFSGFVERSRKQYYNAFTLIEQNKKISDVLDVTPFLDYFTRYVYNKIPAEAPGTPAAEDYENALKNGSVTQKETELWRFVLSFYGTGEFSTKQLEKEFQNAAYATIRGFVLKFEKLGLLHAQKYGSRVKYSVK